MNVDKVLPLIDTIVANKYNKHIIDQNGELLTSNIKDIIHNVPSEVDDNQKNDDIIVNVDNDNDDLQIEYEYDTLCIYVPKELQEQIRFAVEYVMSEFDKIGDEIIGVKKEFDFDRFGKIENAEKELENARKNYSANNVNVITNCRVEVGDAIEQLKASMSSVIQKINSIPQDRKMRLFKVKVGNCLEDVQKAREDCYYIIKGCFLYMEIALLLNEKQAAISRIDDTIDFFNSFNNEQLERVEGWNKQKDRFWIDAYKNNISLLEDKRTELKCQNINNIKIEKR